MQIYKTINSNNSSVTLKCIILESINIWRSFQLYLSSYLNKLIQYYFPCQIFIMCIDLTLFKTALFHLYYFSLHFNSPRSCFDSSVISTNIDMKISLQYVRMYKISNYLWHVRQTNYHILCND